MEDHEVPRYPSCHHFQVAMTDGCPWCLKTKLEETLLQNQDLTEALQNMTGLFGEAVTRLKMGSGFTDLHHEAVKGAKAILSKPQNRKCLCGGIGLGVACEPGCPNCGVKWS